MDGIQPMSQFFDIDPELLSGGVPTSTAGSEPAESQAADGEIPSPPFSKNNALPGAEGGGDVQKPGTDGTTSNDDTAPARPDQKASRLSASQRPAVEFPVQIQAHAAQTYYGIPAEVGKYFEYRQDQTMYRPPPGYQLPAHGIIPTRTTSAAHPPHPFAIQYAAQQAQARGAHPYPLAPGQAGPSGHPQIQLGGSDAQYPHHVLSNTDEWAPPDTVWEPMGISTFAQPVMAAEGRAATLRDARLAWMVGELVCGHPACLGRRFERKTNLLKHLLTHVEARPYICKVGGCDQAFKQKWLLDRHSRVHLPSASREVFKCPVEGCGVTCSSQYNLRNHELVHSELKKYHCDYMACNRTFATQRNLRLHQRTHTGDKPFECHYEGCGQKYHRLAHLKRHQEVHLEGGGRYGEGGLMAAEGSESATPAPKRRKGGRQGAGRKKKTRSETPVEEEEDSDDFMNDPSPDEDSGDDEFGRDEDDLASSSKTREPAVTRTRSGRVSRGVVRGTGSSAILAIGVNSQAAARLLAAAAAVDAEEAAAANAAANAAAAASTATAANAAAAILTAIEETKDDTNNNNSVGNDATVEKMEVEEQKVNVLEGAGDIEGDVEDAEDAEMEGTTPAKGKGKAPRGRKNLKGKKGK